MTPPLPPFRKIDWMKRDISVERRDDGVIVIRSNVPLGDYERHLGRFLDHWAKETPDNVWLAQRAGPGRQWRKVTFAEARRIVDGLTQAILDLGLTPERPVAILSGNSIEHALMTFAAMQAGVPAAPISQAYSLMSDDHLKLKTIFAHIHPGLVLVQDGPTFDKALAALDLKGAVVVHVARPSAKVASRAFADLAATPVTPAVAKAEAALTSDTIGKLLFTSGSTGMPKAVINTQRMMCANVQMIRQGRPRHDHSRQPVYLDWMPWNHTMGGNAMFNVALAEGGALYIDDGRPQPGAFDETIRNLREISPTYYANVPAGYAMLAAALEHDDALARNFFRDLGIMAYGGARLPDDLHDRMQALAIRTTGERIVFFTGWGSTETAPVATAPYWNTERVGYIGLPYAGVELKMLPVGGKYELRIRGINVMPGYYKQPELTTAAFDEEGFYKIGDAGTFADPDNPEAGLVFSGRVVEDFKLTTGTFVHVGALRVEAIASTSPVVQDALVAGQDREVIGLLAWPNLEACRRLIGDPGASAGTICAHPSIHAHVRDGLRRMAQAAHGASSMRVARAMLMSEPPSIDGNELTDKGYINQRAGLERRAALVERLYAATPDAAVIIV
jgi:feruloyl-CoA synthase